MQQVSKQGQPHLVVILSTSKDSDLRREFKQHLSLLLRNQIITLFDTQEIIAGTDWQQAYYHALDQASLVLLLISSAFLADDQCYSMMQSTLKYHDTRAIPLIPLLLSPVSLEDAPFNHLQYLPHSKQPITAFNDKNEAFRQIVIDIREVINNFPIEQHKRRLNEREIKLHALLADHDGFLRSRLEHFVGRQHELSEIQERIAEQLLRGGFVTITGQAGQGKSSIIAKLIMCFGVTDVAFHFIPLNPGPDHQVGLLRNVMARLILKYSLTDLYVASDSRAALRDYFPKVLQEVVDRGGKEIIFIDGLDQLEEDFDGVRDLSFLPPNPPVGIVFVLGTRPNDTLKPLTLLKQHDEYRLPNLSQEDFDLILQRYHISLERELTDQFYKAMGENALYLNLVAKELAEHEIDNPITIINRISQNPDQIFSLAIERLKRHALWEMVIYPVLGILLAVQEPLALRHLLDILQVKDFQLREGIVRLGGLVTEDHQRKYTLFHRKLRDYLLQDEEQHDKEYIFSTWEVREWHTVLATWCAKPVLSAIWQDTKNLTEQERHLYAKYHYVAHLYHAHKWEDLFSVLNEHAYGYAKERFDPSGRLLAQDLDYGRRAVISSERSLDDGMLHLPLLWQYTLLRCSLRSRADQYPLTTFQLLLNFNRETEALGLAELLTSPKRKVEVLLLIAKHLAHQSREKGESDPIFLRTHEIINSIKDDKENTDALAQLVEALAHAQQWEQSLSVAHSIKLRDRNTRFVYFDSEPKTRAFGTIAVSLVDAQHLEQALNVSHFMDSGQEKVQVLIEIASALTRRLQRRKEALQLWKEAKDMASLLPTGLSGTRDGQLEHLTTALVEAQLWKQAESVARLIDIGTSKVRAITTLATALTKAQQEEQAAEFWHEAEAIAISIRNDYEQSLALRILAVSLAEIGLLNQAINMARTIKRDQQKALTLTELAALLFENKQQKQALILSRKAERIINALIKNNEKSDELTELMTMLIKAKQWEYAETIWIRAKTFYSSWEQDFERNYKLGSLADALIEAQQWEKAEIVVQVIDSGKDKAEALSELAIGLLKVGEQVQARRLLGEIEQILSSFDETSYPKTFALQNLATALLEVQQWKEAESVAYSIEEKPQKSSTLIGLAAALYQSHLTERAEALWKDAEIVIRTIENSYTRIDGYTVLASELAKTQKEVQVQSLWSEIESIAHHLEAGTWKMRALHSVVQHKIQLHEPVEELLLEAESVYNSIEKSSFDKGYAFDVLISALVDARCWEWVERLVISMNQFHYEAIGACGKLIDCLVETGQEERVEHITRSIKDNGMKNSILNKFVSALAKTHQWKHAGVVARSIRNTTEKARAFRELVAEFAQDQQWEKAKKIAFSIKDDDTRAQALTELIAALVDAQQWDLVDVLLDQAMFLILSIEHYSSRKLYLLTRLAIPLTKGLYTERTDTLWQQAEMIVHSTLYRDDKEQGLQIIVEALIESQMLKRAEVVAFGMEEGYQKAKVFKELAHILFSSREYEQLLALIQNVWLQAETRDYTLEILDLALPFVPIQSELGIAFYKALVWTDTFLQR